MRHQECFNEIWESADHLPPLWFVALGALFLAFGLMMLFGGKIQWVRRMFATWTDPARIVFAAIFVLIAGVWTSIFGYGIIAEWRAFRHDTRQVVTGPVEHFHAMPSTGHDNESFTVSGVRFSYSDYEVTSGFNNTLSHGGPDLANKTVRIEYLERHNGNVIAKLSVGLTPAQIQARREKNNHEKSPH